MCGRKELFEACGDGQVYRPISHKYRYTDKQESYWFAKIENISSEAARNFTAASVHLPISFSIVLLPQAGDRRVQIWARPTRNPLYSRDRGRSVYTKILPTSAPSTTSASVVGR